MPSSQTLQQTINSISASIRFLPITMGTSDSTSSNEPAVSFGNRIKQVILNNPFAWPWNRASVSFSAVAGTQDYAVTLGGSSQTASGATAANPTVITVATAPLTGVGVSITGATGNWTPVNGGWIATKISGTTFSIPVDASGFGALTGTLVVQAGNDNYGWLEQASLTGADGDTFQIYNIKNALTADSQQGRPVWIAPLIDDNAGTITFRLTPVPEQAYTVKLLYQKKPTSFTSNLSGTWDPIPDDDSYIYQHGFQALAMQYAGDPGWVQEYQIFVQSLVGNATGLDEIQKSSVMESLLMPTMQAAFANKKLSGGL